MKDIPSLGKLGVSKAKSGYSSRQRGGGVVEVGNYAVNDPLWDDMWYLVKF